MQGRGGGGSVHRGVSVAIDAVRLGLHQRFPHLLGTRLQIDAAAEFVVAQWGRPADKQKEDISNELIVGIVRNVESKKRERERKNN